MKKRPSLKNIAEKVGVSIATVSYVLSGNKKKKVSTEVAEKILAVAKELDYQPNQLAKSLKSGKSLTIGLIVADISNPFFSNIARIIEDEAAKRNYTVLFGSSDEKAEKSSHLVQLLMNRQVDGFIIVPTEGTEELLKLLKKKQVPFVLIDRHFPEIKSSHVIIDNYDAAYQAVARLIETGNEKISIIAYDNYLSHLQGRIKGALGAMQDAGITFNRKWLKELSYSHVQAEMKAAIEDVLLSKDRVTAIFFATNTLAIHGLREIDQLGLRVPSYVSIVCFDQGEAFDFYYAPLTYVEQPLVEIGQNAVKLLLDQIESPVLSHQEVLLKAKLVIRKSCGGKEVVVSRG